MTIKSSLRQAFEESAVWALLSWLFDDEICTYLCSSN